MRVRLVNPCRCYSGPGCAHSCVPEEISDFQVLPFSLSGESESLRFVVVVVVASLFVCSRLCSIRRKKKKKKRERAFSITIYSDSSSSFLLLAALAAALNQLRAEETHSLSLSLSLIYSLCHFPDASPLSLRAAVGV